jgi:hypothetical protein
MTISFAGKATSLLEFAQQVDQLVAGVGRERAAELPVAFPTNQGGGTAWPDNHIPSRSLVHGVTLHEGGGGLPDHVLVQ